MLTNGSFLSIQIRQAGHGSDDQSRKKGGDELKKKQKLMKTDILLNEPFPGRCQRKFNLYS
jgi:hypothetical protein